MSNLIDTLSTARLAEIHNAFSDRKVRKFESRVAAKRRIEQLLNMQGITFAQAAAKAGYGAAAEVTTAATTKKGNIANAMITKVTFTPTGDDKSNEIVGPASRDAIEREAPAPEPGQPAPAPATPAAATKRTRAPATAPGEWPTPPDFTAATHKPYRAKLAALLAAASERDIAALNAVKINPTSSSPKALERYRIAAIAAIEAEAARDPLAGGCGNRK